MKELELYIHVPFCIRKCAYCDFLSFTSKEEERENYAAALLKEIEGYRTLAKEYRVTTIFIGGGTPSVLETSLLKLVIRKVRDVFYIEPDVEFTIEVNPGTVSKEKVQVYRQVGINRISIGLQATNNEELSMLGRIHTYEEFLQTYQLIRENGIDNINVDLISAIPKQTVTSWAETMERVIALEPTHISAYSLIIEEGTLLYEKLDDYEELLPSEDAEREMYHITKTRLGEAGYYRYEISNYAKEGYECRHNLGYWDRVDYLGMGLGAASCIDNVRWCNETHMERYINQCKNGGDCSKGQERLSKQEQMEEFMFLGLRKIEGVSIHEFEQQFEVEMESVYGEIIEALKKKELLVEELTHGERRLKLTELGIDVSNQVMVEFIR